MSLKVKSNGINFNVPTIEDLPTERLEEDLVCVVTDENRGGVFVYRAANALVNNGGTIFNGWTRQYDGAVNVKWFGVVGDGVTDDYIAFMSALTINNEVMIPSGCKVCISSPITGMYYKKIIGEVGTVNLQDKWHDRGAYIICEKEFIDQDITDTTNTLSIIVDNVHIVSSARYATAGAFSTYTAINQDGKEFSYNSFTNCEIRGFNYSMEINSNGWYNEFNNCIFDTKYVTAAFRAHRAGYAGDLAYDGQYNRNVFSNCTFVSAGTGNEIGFAMAGNTYGYDFVLDNCIFEGIPNLISNSSIKLNMKVLGGSCDNTTITSLEQNMVYDGFSFYSVYPSDPNSFMTSYTASANNGLVTNCFFAFGSGAVHTVPYKTINATNNYRMLRGTYDGKAYYETSSSTVSSNTHKIVNEASAATTSAYVGTDYYMKTSNSATTPEWVGALRAYRDGNTTKTQLYFTSKNADNTTTIKTFLNNSSFYPAYNNSMALGLGSNLWTALYAASGTINTSDARVKTFLTIDDVELRVAKELKGLVKKFKFNDAIEAKGVDDARIHYGTSAQEVIAVFEKHGLDAMQYAMVCYDEWEETPETKDEEGNVIQEYRPAGNRYGIRYEELIMFILGAM